MKIILLTLLFLGMTSPVFGELPITRHAASLERLETLRDSLRSIQRREPIVYQGSRSHGIGGTLEAGHRNQQQHVGLARITAFPADEHVWLVELHFSQAPRQQGDAAVTLMPAGYRHGSLEQTAAAQQIERAITVQGSHLSSAYRRSLREIPDLQGSLLIAMELTPSGSVARLNVEQSEIRYPALEGRIVELLRHVTVDPRQLRGSHRQYQAAN